MSAEEKKYKELLENAPQATDSSSTIQSQNNLIAAENAQIPSNYTGVHDAKLDKAINEWLTSKGFNYNSSSDKAYQQYADEYNANAQLGRDISRNTANTLANGYVPTYADAVASGVYNQQIANTTDAIPTFKNLAQQDYNAEKNRLANAASIYSSLDNTAYSRDRDTTADYKNYLNYLYNRYSTDKQNDVNLDSIKADIYASQLNAAQSNLADAQNYKNQRYLYNTQSASSKAQIAQNENENNQKIEYYKKKDEYEATQAKLKAQQKKNEKGENRAFKKNVNDYIEAYDLKNANKEFAATQIAIGFADGYLTEAEAFDIAKTLGINDSEIIEASDKLTMTDAHQRRGK